MAAAQIKRACQKKSAYEVRSQVWAITLNSKTHECKLLSLHARGFRCFEKRKAVFAWLMQQEADICFLQETYSTKKIENSWKEQWKGKCPN